MPSQKPDASNAAMVGAARNAKYLAIVAIILAVTAPFFEDALLGTLNIHTPAALGLLRLTVAEDRQDRQSQELDSQISAVTKDTALLKAQAANLQTRGDTSQAWTRTMALVQLGAVLRHPGPFDLELAFVRATGAAPADMAPMLVKIEPYAATGIQSVAQLRTQFADIRGRIEAKQGGLLPSGWMADVINLPRAMVGSSAGSPASLNPATKILNDTAAQLSRDNLTGALASLQQITDPTRDMFVEWMEDAGARISADTVAQRINDVVVLRTSLGAAASAAKPASRP